jgi:hypothetical protein
VMVWTDFKYLDTGQWLNIRRIEEGNIVNSWQILVDHEGL